MGTNMQPLDFANANFYKASYTNGQGACVEVAFVDGGVGVRDSKLNRSLGANNPIQGFSRAAFGALVDTVKSGQADMS